MEPDHYFKRIKVKIKKERNFDFFFFSFWVIGNYGLSVIMRASGVFVVMMTLMYMYVIWPTLISLWLSCLLCQYIEPIYVRSPIYWAVYWIFLTKLYTGYLATSRSSRCHTSWRVGAQFIAYLKKTPWLISQ